MMFIFYAVSFWLGYESLWGFWRGETEKRIIFFLAPAAGLVITSLILFTSLLSGFGLPRWPLLGLHLLLATLFFLKRKHKIKKWPPVFPGGILLFSILILAWLLAMIVLFKAPFGNGVDVWAVWALKARFIYADPLEWKKIFSSSLYYSHPDYPLLEPLGLVWGWLGAGNETPAASWMIASVTAISTAGLLMTGISRRISRIPVLAVFFLISTPQWNGMVSSLYVDALLAYFILCGIVLLDRSTSENGGPWPAAGFMAGAAMLVKNEGWLFAVSVVFSALLWIFLSRRPLKLFFQFLAGFLFPVFFAVILKMMAHTPPHNLSAELFCGLFRWPVFLERMEQVISAYHSQIFNENAWVYAWFGLGALAAVMGRKIFLPEKIPVWLPLILLNAGYVLIYLQTPWGTKESLDASLDRLLLHSFPALIFILFQAISLSGHRNVLGWLPERRP